MAKYRSLEEQVAFYDKMWSRDYTLVNIWHRFGWTDIHCRMYNIMRALRTLGLSSSNQILDIGCGLGRFSKPMSKYGSITGIDLSERAIAICREAMPDGKFLAGNFLEIDLPDEGYDLVLATEVIEHVPHDLQRRFIEKVAGHLKRNGFLILTTNNGSFPDIPISELQPLEEWLTPEELRIVVSPYLQVKELRTMRYKFNNKWIDRVYKACYPLNRYIEEQLLKTKDIGCYLFLVAQKK